jgi:hypothetical protein
MKIFDFFSFFNRQEPEQFQREQRSERTDPNHPDHYKRYWNKPDTDWSDDVVGIQVRDTCVYLLRSNSEELIATRYDHRAAYGYAKTLRERRQVQIIDLPKIDRSAAA